MEFYRTITQLLELEIREKFDNPQKMANQTGIPYMTIKNVLKRSAENSSLATIKKICDALQFSIGELYSQQKYDTLGHKVATLKEKYSDYAFLEDAQELRLIPQMNYMNDEYFNNVAERAKNGKKISLAVFTRYETIDRMK